MMYTVHGKDKDPASFIKIKTDPIDIESEMKGYVKKSLHFLMHGILVFTRNDLSG